MNTEYKNPQYDLIVSLAVSLALTLFFEVLFFIIIGKRNKKDLLLVILVNALTNPIVVLLYNLMLIYTQWNKALIMAPLEISAVLTEGYLYKKYGNNFNRPFAFSLAANSVSFFAGMLIGLLFRG
jgi:hypothetical protein